MTWSQLFQEYGIWGAFWGLSMGVMLFVLSKLVSLGRLERGIEAVDHRLTQVELRLVEKIDASDRQLSDKMDALDQRLNDKMDALDQRLTTHSAHLHEQLSTWATQFEKRLDRVESRLEGLEGKLDQLLAK